MVYILDMNLWHLAIFHAAAESGSISAGAARLHISQPAATRQLRELEARLGSVLFDRLPRGVRLTETGQLLHDYAQRIFALEHEAENAIRDMEQLGGGEIKIGASSTIGNYLLPPVIAGFRRRFPAVELTVEIANTETIERDLVARRLVLGFTEGPLSEPEVNAEVFMHDEIIPVAGAVHPLTHMRRVDPQALCRETLLIREPGSGTRSFIEGMLKRKRLEFKNVVCLGSSEAIKQVAAAGGGVAFVSRLVVESELRSGRLRVLRVAGLRISRPLHRVQLRRRHLPPAVQAFLALLPRQSPQRYAERAREPDSRQRPSQKPVPCGNPVS